MTYQMDFNKVKVEIAWSGRNIGYGMTCDGENVSWESLTREEQLKIIGAFNQGVKFFFRFLKDE